MTNLYEETYQKSLNDPDGFWGSVAAFKLLLLLKGFQKRDLEKF
jgi:hypothetical protein